MDKEVIKSVRMEWKLLLEEEVGMVVRQEAELDLEVEVALDMSILHQQLHIIHPDVY